MRHDLERRLARLLPKRASRTERYVFVTAPSREECDAEIERLKAAGEASEHNLFVPSVEPGPTRSKIVDFPPGTTALLLKEIDAVMHQTPLSCPHRV